MSFFRDISPVGAIRDLRGVWFDNQPYKWRFLAAAAVATLTIFIAFFNESGFQREWKRPTIIWVQKIDPNRSEAEIHAENLERQIDKDIRAQRRAEAEAERRAQYRRLAEQLGIDTE